MLEVLKDAFRTAVKSPFTWIAAIAVPLIVACFGLLYWTTFIDPYDRIKELPIAVVNEDTGAQVGGEWSNYGDDLAQSICDTDSAKWTMEDESLVENGLENSDYYMAIVIPDDFSSRVVAGQTGDPETAGIAFFKNARKNYMLSTIANTIESSLSKTVNEKVGAQYVTAYVEGLQKAAGGFGSAADGSGALATGLANACDGSSQLSEGAQTLSDGASQLSDASQSAYNGAQSASDATSTLQNGTASLQTGLQSIASATDRLASQGQSLVDGSTATQNAISAIKRGSDTYASTLDQQSANIAAAAGGDPASATALAQQQFSAAIGRYAANVAQATANGQDASLVDTSEVQQAAQGIAQAASAAGAYQALAQTKDGYAALSDGITQLDAQYGTLDSGIQAYSRAVSLVDAGAKNASTASAALASGTSQLNEGADKLTQGLSAIAKGSASLDDGAQQLADSTSSLKDGLQTAHDGSEELTSQLQQGAQTIDESVASDPQTLGEYAVNPIDVNDEVYGSLDKFGYGFAPLFLTLCMWLGALLVFFVFDPFPSRTHLKSNRFAAIFGRWPLYLCMSALEAAVVCIGSLACGLPCTNVTALVALFAVLAVSFMCIMQFFNLFDVPGKALAVLMVILQLVCCSGTFPSELGSDFATSVGPMLPFYCAIDAFREIISGGVIQAALNDMGVLLCFGVAFTAFSLLAYPFALKFKAKRDKQTVQAILGDGATPAVS